MNKNKKKTLIIVFAIALLAIVALFTAIPYLILSSTLSKSFERDVFTSSDYNVEATPVSLVTKDELEIASWMVSAENAKGTLIILSGIENPSVTAFFGYSKEFRDRGYNSLLIEMRAHNQSEGDQVHLAMKEWLDVKAGVDYLKGEKETKDLSIIVFGTSMGGATAIVSAGEIPEIDAVVSVSSYSTFPDAFADNMVNSTGMPSFVGAIEKPFVNLYLGVHYEFSDLKFTPMNALDKIDSAPVLFMHSKEDSQVPFASFSRLTKKAEEIGLDHEKFIRDGDYHFVIKEDFIDNPGQDKEFMETVVGFLDRKFAH